MEAVAVLSSSEVRHFKTLFVTRSRPKAGGRVLKWNRFHSRVELSRLRSDFWSTVGTFLFLSITVKVIRKHHIQ